MVTVKVQVCAWSKDVSKEKKMMNILFPNILFPQMIWSDT